MPRIAREAHATIRQRVDGGEKVAAVGASYGCTPANIYAILAKLRRQDGQEGGLLLPAAEAAHDASVARPEPEMVPAPVQAEVPPASVVAAVGTPAPADLKTAAVPSNSPQPNGQPSPSPAPPVSRSSIAAAPAKPKVSAAVSPTQRSGKPGFALIMRAGDGDEAVNPFRSLDDLLSAAKPILRTAARSPEPVWFSIQPVDLDAVEEAL